MDLSHNWEPEHREHNQLRTECLTQQCIVILERITRSQMEVTQSLRPRRMRRRILDFSENSDSDSRTSDHDVTKSPPREEDGNCDTVGNSPHRQNSRAKPLRIKEGLASSGSAGSFRSRKTLQVKKEPKLYPCKIANCGITYTRQDRLLAHIEKVHAESIHPVDSDHSVENDPVNERRRSLRPRRMRRRILDFTETSDSDSRTSDYDVFTKSPPSEEDGNCNTVGNSSHRQNSRGKPMRIKEGLASSGSAGSFRSRKTLQVKKVPKLYPCKIANCGITYTRQDRLLAHIEKIHAESIHPLDSDHSVENDAVNDRRTSLRLRRMRRRILDFSEISDSDSKTSDYEAFTTALTPPSEVDENCHTRVTRGNSSLQNSGGKPSNERRIGKYSDKSLPVRKAVLATVVKVPTIYCDVCGKKFYREYKLQAHKEREHLEYVPWQHRSKRYVCNVCGLHCKAPSVLSAHAIVHTKEKPFICDICGATYRTSHMLKKHISKKHPDRVTDSEENEPVSESEEIMVDIRSLSNQLVVETSQTFEGAATIPEVKETNVSEVKVECKLEPVAGGDCIASPCSDNKIMMEPSSADFDETDDEPISPFPNLWDVQRKDFYRRSVKLLNDEKPETPLTVAESNLKFPLDVKIESSEEQFDHSARQLTRPVKDERTIRRLRRRKNLKSQMSSRVSRKRKRKPEKGVKCRLTNCRFRAADADTLAAHRINEHGRTDAVRSYKFKCNIKGCTFRARYQESLDSHVFKHQIEGEASYDCPLKCRIDSCRFMAPTHDILARHRSSQHGKTSDIRSYPFKCLIIGCNFRARFENSLESHRLSHTNSLSTSTKISTKSPSGRNKKVTNYPCTFHGCGSIFANRVRLVNHVDNIHHGKAKLTHEFLDSHSLKQQAKGQILQKNPLKCRIGKCRFNASSLDLLVRHRSSEHTGMSDIRSYPFKCLVAGCNFRARYEDSLESHRMSHANSPPASTEVSAKSLSGSKNKVTNYPCTFPDCRRIFPNRIRLVRHIENIHHGKDKLIHCDIPNCKYKGRLIESLEAHRRKVHHRLPILCHFKCSHCPKSFRSNYYRQTHFKLKHSPDVPKKSRYQCKHCEKDFYNRYMLFRHIQRCHPEGKTFPCCTCGKIFYEEAENRKHEIRHARYPETPFRCAWYSCHEICDSLSELQQHVKDAHDTPMDATILCTICGRVVFARSLAKHRQYHKSLKGFTCHVCSKAFRRKSDLDRHSEFHHSHILFQDQAKTQSCAMCNSTFWTKASLKSHERSHKHKPRLNPKVRRTRSTKKKEDAISPQQRQRKKRGKKLPLSLSPPDNFPSCEPDVCKDNVADTLVNYVVQNQGQPTMIHYHHSQYNSLGPNSFPMPNSNPTASW